MFKIKSEADLLKNKINISLLRDMPLYIQELEGNVSDYYVITNALKPNNKKYQNLKNGILHIAEILPIITFMELQYLVECTNIVYTFQDIYTEKELETASIDNAAQMTKDEIFDDKQTFEIMYKTQEPLKDNEDNKIRKGSQFTEQELQSKGLDKSTLLQEGKLIEIKIVK